MFRSTSRDPWDGDDEFLGWGTLVAGGIDVYHVLPNQMTLLLEPGVRILSEQLRECLDRDFAPATTALQVALA
jgi:hypothetical protein